MSTEDPRRVLEVDVAPDRAGEVANALRDLVGPTPEHPVFIPLVDAGVAQLRPFIVLAAASGEPLDEALGRYGPAAIDDALPRLRRLAGALDAAAAKGIYHGGLTPRDILIAGDETFIAGVGVVTALRSAGVRVPAHPPYAAPEVERDRIDAGADQFSLAAIAYEWLFGRPVALATEDIQVRALRDVDANALAKAFSRALARDPRQRFKSCTAFVEALAHSAAAPLPPKPPPPASLPFDDVPMHPREGEGREIRHEAPAALLSDAAPAMPEPSRRGLVMGVIAGAIGAGALLAWLTVGRRGESPPADAAGAGQPFTEGHVASGSAPAGAGAEKSKVNRSVRRDVAPEASPSARAPSDAERRPDGGGASSGRDGGPAPRPASGAQRPQPGSDAVRAAQGDAGLLVHTTPAGAAVVIDGIERGMTPVAVRGLAFGTRTVVVTRPGYHASQRQVTLTPDRPSRSLEISLAPVAASAAPAAAREGSLVVDSRPPGATVTIDGRPAGVTPLTIVSIAPGTHTVRIEHPGYRVVTTTVDVVMGQRARVAARLEGGPHEE